MVWLLYKRDLRQKRVKNDKKSYFPLSCSYFFPDFIDRVEKWLNEKAKIHFNIYDAVYLETCKTTIYVFPNISKNKDNQTMNLARLM